MISEMLADFFARFSIQCDKSSLDNMGKSIDSGKKSLEGLGQVADKISHHLKIALASFAGFEGIKKVFEVNTELNNTFNQLVNATGSADIAKQQLDKIITFADKTKMSILGLTESFGPFENQMAVVGLSADKSLEVFKKMQIAFAGAHLTEFQAQLSQKDTMEFITGAMSMERLKRSELGMRTAILPSIQKKLGVKDPHEADERLKAMTGEQRAKLIADVSYETYSKGQAEYEKGPMAAVVNVKNKFTELAIKIGDSGFMDLAVKSLNSFANALTGVGKVIDFTSNLIRGIKDAFNEVPAVMWTLVGVIGAVTLAFNGARIAMLAGIAVEKMLIVWDGILAVMNGTVALTEIIMAAPIWLIVAGIAAIIAIVALLVDDVYTYFHGGKSVTGLIVNSLKSAFHEFLKWFEKIGISISTWINEKVQHWIQLIDKFGESIGIKIFNAFTKIKTGLTNIFNDIKNLFYDSIIGPIDHLWSKIEQFGGKAFTGVQDKLNGFIPQIQANMSMINPDIGNNYSTRSPILFHSAAPNSSVINQHSFAPSISVNVTGAQGMDERKLASHISSHVEKSLKNHYSAALSDVTRRE